MKWALIIDDVVRDVSSENPEGRFHSSLSWIQCGEDVSHGWRLVKGELQPPEQPLPPTHEEIVAKYAAGVQQHLDTFARARNYDGILSAATYATSRVPKFKAEGQYAVEARDVTWAKCYEVLAAVEAGSRPMPTWDELLAELPVLRWPN